MSQPGWYPDPSGSVQQRWFDGERWTEHVAPYNQPGARGLNSPALMVCLLVAGLVGVYMTNFTQVNVLTGSGTVWVGAVIGGLAAIVAWVVSGIRTWVRVVATVLAAVCLFSAVYVEVQLMHKRDELSSITSMR